MSSVFSQHLVSVLDLTSSKCARRSRVSRSCSSVGKFAVLACCLAVTTISTPPGSLGKAARAASLSRRLILLRSTARFETRLLTTNPIRNCATSFGSHARISSGDIILLPCCLTRGNSLFFRRRTAWLSATSTHHSSNAARFYHVFTTKL